MVASLVEELALHVKTLLVSAVGIIALIPGPDQKGNLRVKGPVGSAITYLGIGLLLAPWIALPFLPQPRYVGLIGSILSPLGVLWLLVGLAIYAASLKHLLPAFREPFTEFTPSDLVVGGPYRLVRHPIYLSCLLIIAGLYLMRSASLSTLFLPLLWAVLRAVTVYEERRILIPKFGEAYLHYRKDVPRTILGPFAGILAAGLYVFLAAITLLRSPL